MSAEECACFMTDPKTWTTYGSAVEPGSMWEPNPECRVHFTEEERNFALGLDGDPQVIPAEAVEAAPSSVPLEYCDGGVCVRMAERWEWAERYSQWLAVCNEHGDRILASQVQK